MATSVERLAGKTAIVTGAGQGVGRGIALALAESGADILLVGRTARKLDSVADEICAEGGEAATLELDITADDAAPRIVDAATSLIGGVDILVNNANLAIPAPLEAYSDEDLLAAFNAGPRATLSLMKAARPHMAARGGGTIINLASSAAVRWDAANYGVYAAVKDARPDPAFDAELPHDPGCRFRAEPHLL